MKLHIELKSYIFHLTQRTRATKRTFTVDEMITVFADHDKRRQHQENNEERVMKTRVFKNKKKNQSSDRGLCKHCNRSVHFEEKC